MQVIALLRGVMPTGKNRIPKMSYLAEQLEAAGFTQVQTYIQSGNVLLETTLSPAATAAKIHDVILEKIGADLSVIIKTKKDFQIAVSENPFSSSLDASRIHVVFTNDSIDLKRLKQIEETSFAGELFASGTVCLYLYLPRNAAKKQLNNNYLEKRLGIVSTMRKLNVIQHLITM